MAWKGFVGGFSQGFGGVWGSSCGEFGGVLVLGSFARRSFGAKG